jgi:hypothetical protein
VHRIVVVREQLRHPHFKLARWSSLTMANPDLAAPSAAILPNPMIHVLSRASRPSCNQLRKSSSAASQIRFANLATSPLAFGGCAVPR